MKTEDLDINLGTPAGRGDTKKAIERLIKEVNSMEGGSGEAVDLKPIKEDLSGLKEQLENYKARLDATENRLDTLEERLEDVENFK